MHLARLDVENGIQREGTVADVLEAMVLCPAGRNRAIRFSGNLPWAPGFRVTPVREERPCMKTVLPDLDRIPFARWFTLFPPYSSLIPLSWEEFANGDCADLGRLACIEWSGGIIDWTILRELLKEARFRDVAAPLVLRLTKRTALSTVPVFRRANVLGVRAIIQEETISDSILRSQMTTVPDLGRDVVRWLLPQIGPIPPVCREYIERAFDSWSRSALDEPTWNPISPRPSHVERLMKKAGLPSPRSWQKIARALCAGIFIQKHPLKPLSVVARVLGYSDQASLSNQFTACFQLRPSRIRDTLGWEGLLNRWGVLRTPIRVHLGTGVVVRTS